MKYGCIRRDSEPFPWFAMGGTAGFGLHSVGWRAWRWRQAALVTTMLVPVVLVAGCASPRPVIYQAAPGSGQDVEQCMQLARASGADSGKGAAAARDVGLGAAMGGAAAGAWGGVRGYSDVGNRAAAGAAAGASAALIRGAVRASEPSEVYRGYVNQCLRDRGHQVVGWR